MSDPTVDVREEDAFDVAAMARLAARARRRTCPDGDARRAAVPRRRVQPDLPAVATRDRDLILRRPPSGAKAKSAHDMRREFTIQSRLAPVFGLRARHGRVLRRPGRDRLGLLRHGAAGRHDPAPRPARRARAVGGRRPRAVHELPRRARRAALGRPAAGRARRPRQGRRLRRAAGRRLVGPLPQGPHRQRRRLRAGDGLARRAPAGRRRDLRDPQRLPARQRRARRRTTRCGSSACSTGRWPRSATR